MDIQYRTTLLFNEDQKRHFPTIFKDHPEHPKRIEEVVKRLERTGILEQAQVLKGLSQEEINEIAANYDSVQMCPGSAKASFSAISCAGYLTQLVLGNKIPNGFALTRPPGHHAMVNEANGFCIFNNIVFAAHTALKSGVKRILILDFDVHHGQGTQRCFYNDPRVLYCSIHRYEHARFWPHLQESNFDYVGEGIAKGYNVNIPINQPGATDADYLFLLLNLICPLAREFQPQIVLVSAGFDACIGDPVGGMKLCPDLFAHFIYHIAPCSGGKIALILEGGYHHKMAAVCVEKCIRVLLGGKPSPVSFQNISRGTVSSYLNVLSALKSYWKCLHLYNHLDHRIIALVAKPLPTPALDDNKVEGVTGNINQDFLYPGKEMLEQKSSVSKPKVGIFGAVFSYCLTGLEKNSCYTLAFAEESIVEATDCLFLANAHPNKLSSLLAIIVPGLGHDKHGNSPNCINSQDIFLKSLKYALSKNDNKRLLVVDLNADIIDFPPERHFVKDEDIVYLIVRRKEHSQLKTSIKLFNENRRDILIEIPTDFALGEKELMALLYQIVMPVAYEFSPALVMLSCLNNGPNPTPHSYAQIIQHLSALADGRLCVLWNKENHSCSSPEKITMILQTLLSTAYLRNEVLETKNADLAVWKVISQMMNLLRLLREVTDEESAVKYLQDKNILQKEQRICYKKDVFMENTKNQKKGRR